MALENFIIDEMRRQSVNNQQGFMNNNQVLGANTAGLGASCCPGGNVLGANAVAGLGADCCPTNNNAVLGANALAGLGANCCPTGGEVLGVSEGGTRTIEVPEVLGVGTGNTLVDVCIPIIPAGFTILYNSIERNVVFDALVASNGKVFINGRLIKKIPFEVCDRQFTPTTGTITRVVLSNVRAITVEIPFALCIPVRGAVRGTQVVVLNTTVDSVELPNLRCPEQPCIRGVVEKDCITVTVKVVRDTVITVPATTAAL